MTVGKLGWNASSSLSTSWLSSRARRRGERQGGEAQRQKKKRAKAERERDRCSWEYITQDLHQERRKENLVFENNVGAKPQGKKEQEERKLANVHSLRTTRPN